MTSHHSETVRIDLADRSYDIVIGEDLFSQASTYQNLPKASAALIVSKSVTDLSSIKTHSGLITTFSLLLVKTGHVSVELGKSINKVEDLRLLADYKGEDIALAQAQWALKEAREFVLALQKYNQP